jgi:hypothetical protein
MAFTFLHTGDWHIGRTFSGFEPDTASLLKHARLTAIDRLAAAALVAGSGHVVVCGDLFDRPGLPDRTLLETLSKLAGYPSLIWLLLPGNHDPARSDGIWQRIALLGVPGNVRLLLKSEPEMIVPGVALLPAPLATKAVSSDPTAWMDRAETPPGTIRIGVAHGSTQGFGSAATPSIAIDPNRRVAARLDYLALGDWHGVREIAAGVWYSGTPEPDQFPDNEPGFALAVTIEAAGAAPNVVRMPTGAYAWMKRVCTVTSAADLEGIAAEVAALGPRKSNVLLELTLQGTVSLVADAAIAARLAALEPGLFQLRVQRDSLRLDAGGDDIAAIKDPQIAQVAAKLNALRAVSADAGIAEGALRRLFVLNRAAEGQRS